MMANDHGKMMSEPNSC